MYGRVYDPGVVPYLRRVALAPRAAATELLISQQRWGFHTVHGGIDPGDSCFCLRFVGVVDLWNG